MNILFIIWGIVLGIEILDILGVVKLQNLAGVFASAIQCVLASVAVSTAVNPAIGYMLVMVFILNLVLGIKRVLGIL